MTRRLYLDNPTPEIAPQVLPGDPLIWQSTKLTPIANPWHTLLVLAVLVLLSFGGIWRTHYVIAHPEYDRIYMYLRSILAECITVVLVVWGVRKSGASLSTLLGRHWSSPKDFFRDIGIAAVFWIVALILIGTLRTALPASPTKTSPATPSQAEANSDSGSQESAEADKSKSAETQKSKTVPKRRRDPAEVIRSRVPAVLYRMAPRGRMEILMWIWLSFTAGICEEIVFRGYLQRQFAAWIGAPLGIVVSSTFFGFGHLYQGRNSAIVIGFYGILLGLLALYRKSLLPGVLAHSWQDTLSGLLLALVRR